MQKLVIVTIGALLLSFKSYASDQQVETLDQKLQKIISTYNLKPLEKMQPAPTEKIRLGAFLFHEIELSGPKNVACFNCHHPRFGTSDGMAFSIGEGGTGIGGFRKQGTGGLTKRHSPHLINIGYTDIEFMFWDGRVHRDEQTGVLTTPEPALNGKNPAAKDIVDVMTSSLAVQLIFPLVNELEMKGDSGNDIADTANNLEAWEAIMKRLMAKTQYADQFKKAFPNTTKFNIGHVGEALATFVGRNFNLVDTPYDRYLKGDVNAMSDEQKRGMLVFGGKGKCVECHNGRHLSNFEFYSVGVPQFAAVADSNPFDEGRYEVTKDPNDLYRFRTPPLRNISLTAPFMHNGAFKTLEEVVDHFMNVTDSMANFDLSGVDMAPYNETFVLDTDVVRNDKRVQSMPIQDMKKGTQLTQSEKLDLLKFLETALLDMRLQRR